MRGWFRNELRAFVELVVLVPLDTARLLLWLGAFSLVKFVLPALPFSDFDKSAIGLLHSGALLILEVLFLLHVICRVFERLFPDLFLRFRNLITAAGKANKRSAHLTMGASDGKVNLAPSTKSAHPLVEAVLRIVQVEIRREQLSLAPSTNSVDQPPAGSEQIFDRLLLRVRATLESELLKTPYQSRAAEANIVAMRLRVLARKIASPGREVLLRSVPYVIMGCSDPLPAAYQQLSSVLMVRGRSELHPICRQ